MNNNLAWMTELKDGYMDFKGKSDNPIVVEVWKGKSTVGLHRHVYGEFSLVTKGSCIHSYRGSQVPLIPGDVFLIKPHLEHGYKIHAEVEIINCQFYPDKLGVECSQILQSTTSEMSSMLSTNITSQWEELLEYVSMTDNGRDGDVRQANLEKQGILHLKNSEMMEAESIFYKMIQEQEDMQKNAIFAESAYLQLILILLSRVKAQSSEKIRHHSHKKKEMIFDTLVYIEEHLDEKIDFTRLIEDSFLSPSYFRTLFKDVTGLSPIEYLNRMRIVKSLEYLEMDKCTIGDAAAKVGIYDRNYYSRLFKKVMGYSPKYFKSIN